MIGGVETSSTRIRPLSGGFWTLLSWLRGEEHSASSESISSAGSDRTAVSFAFLAPTHYHSSATPLVVPPPGPPTDSYRKRVRERNLRRQYDRDITLHRKYGLFRGENTVNFDIHSLPAPRKVATVNDWKDRERRAASECHQRRTAHVPGKRRAPPPPLRIQAAPDVITVPSSATTRRQSRKRPAPKPPSQITQANKINNICFDKNNKTKMNQSSSPETRPLPSLGLECKQEKYVRKETNLKDVKMRPERSFLKQIFENKKRNSAVDTSLVKVLPSISELDKQAAEIIETSKVMKQNQNRIGTECVWYCIKCSRRYDKSVDTCLLCNIKQNVASTSEGGKKLTIYTQTERESPSKSTSKDNNMVEKQKLKEMLKEMKDSLPKRAKHDNLAKDKKNLNKGFTPPIETPTLPIGSSIQRAVGPINKPTCNNQSSKASETKKTTIQFNDTNMNKQTKINLEKVDKKNIQISNNERKALDTPLKISSLLNPIYIPKTNDLLQDQSEKNSLSEIKPIPVKIESPSIDPIYIKAADAVRDILLNKVAVQSTNSPPLAPKHKHITNRCSNANLNSEQSTSTVANQSIKETKVISTDINYIDKINNHSKRRDLVNQLEKSIANGDERAAAEAAMQLAQLRLSCSVLSFSTQILQNSQNLPHSTSNNVATPKPDVLNNTTATSTGGSSILSNENAIKIDPLKSNLTENNKRGFKSHDASTSTNNFLIQKNNKLPMAIATKNQPLKVEEHPSHIKHHATPKNSSSILEAKENKCEITRSAISDNKHKSNEKCDNVSMALTQPSTSKEKDGNAKSIAIWIEDKEKAHGPIHLRISINANVGELRRQAEQTLGLPMRLQRWIVGKELCNNDNTALVTLAGPDLDAPFYLCVVECDENVQNHIRDLCADRPKGENVNNTDKIGEKSNDVYNELVQLERQAVVPNVELFVCDICIEDCVPGDGVVLRECAHSFCRPCLVDVIRHCEEPAVACPAMGCLGLLHEREIRALVSPEDYERWLNRGLAAAESGTRNAFHCRTRDCTGWALCDTGARRFPCPVCKHINCVPCQAIHEGETCEQYQMKLKAAAAADTVDQTDEGTRELIDSLISRGEALQCPECNAVITKKWGCDWVKCSACKTEICWVTRGRRWGPAGRGDTSAGCRCGVDGKRCHPSCAYCH